VECAGQEALRAHGAAILAAGIDLMPIATGAFADHDFRGRMIETARASGARILIPAGATAGLDGLGALAAGGLERVIYISTKPPHAWRGTPAEQAVDLDRVTAATVFYEGPADQAALAYPRNANLAATVALAGAGFERTTVRLVADPQATGNASAIEAEGTFGTLSVKLSGPAMADNPRTSAVTALSIVRALRNEAGTLVI
jgi:aspartate dehydrogenase